MEIFKKWFFLLSPEDKYWSYYDLNRNSADLCLLQQTQLSHALAHMHTHMHTYIGMHTHTFFCTHMHSCVHTYTHTFMHTNIHTCTTVYTYTCMHTFLCTHIHTPLMYTHTHMHACAHIYMHARTHNTHKLLCARVHTHTLLCTYTHGCMHACKTWQLLHFQIPMMDRERRRAPSIFHMFSNPEQWAPFLESASLWNLYQVEGHRPALWSCLSSTPCFSVPCHRTARGRCGMW